MKRWGITVGYRLRHGWQVALRLRQSLRLRGWRGTWRRLQQWQGAQAPEPIALQLPVQTGFDDSLRLPCSAQPRASVIVPVYGQLDYTLNCLRALSDCGDRTPFEVIVIDDASPEDHSESFKQVVGLRYQRNTENLGFIGACNTGAGMARGEFLVFLNNDTAVQPGWLDALLATFDRHPDTGLAGSQLVYPDGRLQEAGGIVFADGSAWNYGRFDDPRDPRYAYVREVDYCSGAAIALRRALFEQLDGFDQHYAPAYFEDTDLAMRVHQCGLKVRYQPASVVVHYEGISSGTDVRHGVKAQQPINQRKFLQRWQDVLRQQHPAAGSDLRLACDYRARHRVLLIDAATPTPDRDSGSVRLLALLDLLHEQGCSTTFFAESLQHDGAYTQALQQGGTAVWWQPWLASVPHWLREHGRTFDLLIVSRHFVLAPLLPLLRRYAPQARIVFDTVDLHHLREQREAELSGDPARLRAAARTRDTELALIDRVDATWVVSEAERQLLASLRPRAPIDVVSNIHQVRGPGPAVDQREGLLFVGGFLHPPNVDAALWLAREILPRIQATLPGLTLHLVGGHAPPSIQALQSLPGVQLHGYVPDLVALIDRSRIGVAPLRYGAGVKGKVNHALAHGQPVVATKCAIEGMHLVDGEDVLIADSAEAFADAVIRLYRDPVLWQQLAEGGLANTRRHFSPEAARPAIQRLLASLPTR